MVTGSCSANLMGRRTTLLVSATGGCPGGATAVTITVVVTTVGTAKVSAPVACVQACTMRKSTLARPGLIASKPTVEYVDACHTALFPPNKKSCFADSCESCQVLCTLSESVPINTSAYLVRAILLRFHML